MRSRLGVISLGEELRKMSQGDSERGRAIQETMRRGDLVPSQWIEDILQEKVIEHVDKELVVVDGFPRNKENWVMWNKNLVLRSRPLVGVCLLLCPVEIMMSRVMGRRQERIDDEVDALKRRIESFETDTLKVISEIDCPVFRIDSRGTPEEVHRAFCATVTWK